MEIKTQRLLLNQPQDSDAQNISHMLNHPIYSENTLNIPYPYTEEHAQFWINLAKEGLTNKNQFIFAIKLKDTNQCIGGIDLTIDLKNNKGEIGYWIDKNLHNLGYATEACRAIVDFGFKNLNLKRIFATHFENNLASGKVLEKTGLTKEGILKSFTRKNGLYQDHVLYSIINSEI